MAELVVSGSYDNTCIVWEADTGDEIITFEEHSEIVNSVDFSSDNNKIVSGSEDKMCIIWDLENGDEITTFEGHSENITSVCFSSDDSKVVSGGKSEETIVWDAETGEEITTFEGYSGDSSDVSSVCFSSDGSKVVSGEEYGNETAIIWDAETGDEITTFEGHSDSVKSVCFSSDDTKVVSGSWDETVIVWDAETGDEITTFEGHSDRVQSVQFSSDDSKVVSGGNDNTVIVWDADTGDEITTFEGHSGSVKSVCFSSDDTKVVSGGRDNICIVWDAETGDEITTFEGHSSIVTSVNFSNSQIELYSLIDYDDTIYTYENEEFSDTGLSRPLKYADFVEYGIEDLSDITEDDWSMFTSSFEILSTTTEDSLDIEFDYKITSDIKYLVSTDGDNWYGYDSDDSEWKKGYRMSKTELEDLTETQINNFVDTEIHKTDFYYRIILSSNEEGSNPLLEEINTSFKENQAPIISDPTLTPESFYTDTHLTATLRDLEGDVIDYRIMIKTPEDSEYQQYSDWKSIESGYEIDEVIENDYFYPGENEIKIETYDQRGAETDWESSVTMLNEDPLIMYSYNEFEVWGTIDDEYDYDVRYQLEVNGEVVKEFGDFEKPPIEFSLNWDEAEDIIEFGQDNSCTITAEDEFDATATETFEFEALERGLFFVDKYGRKYSDADGIVKELLELDSVTAGRTPKPHVVYLRNYTGYDMDDMEIWAEYDEEHENIKIMFDNSLDFVDPKEVFEIPDLISTGEEKEFYVGAVTDIGKGKSGYNFTVRARGDYIDR